VLALGRESLDVGAQSSQLFDGGRRCGHAGTIVDSRRTELGNDYAAAILQTIDGEAEDLKTRSGSVRWPTAN
jgi:hypothetical protein